MIAEIQSRILRPHPATVGMRQHVAARAGNGMSRRMARLVTLIICASLFVVFAFSQVMHWQIASSDKKFAGLRAERHGTTSRNIELLAAKAQMTSRKYVEQRAAEKFGLRTPQQYQMRRL